MNKELALRILKLLSAIEACGMMQPNKMPDYLFDNIEEVVGTLTREVLK